MNLKFFILGLYVLVSIAQVHCEPLPADNAQIAGKPNQFMLMELNSHPKRNILSDLFALEAEKTADLDRVKREELIRGRRFNPLEAIGKIAQKPMELVMKEGMEKLFASYNDPSKPFGPTYDTTWGSPPSPDSQEPANRRMNGDDEQPPQEEVKMSTMIQPPAGQSGYYTYEVHRSGAPPADQVNPQEEVKMSTMIQPPPGQSGYYSYQVQQKQQPAEEVKMSTMIQPPPGQSGYYSYQVHQRPVVNYRQPGGYYTYGVQNPMQTQRSFGHSLEPNLPYQANYDQNINGKQTVFSGQPSANFPFMRRSNSQELHNKIMKIVKESPREIQQLMSEIKKAAKTNGLDDLTRRNGFLGDVYEKEEEQSAEKFSSTQVEFNGSSGEVAIGNRRFDNSADIQEFGGQIDKLFESCLKGIAVVISYLYAVIDTGTVEQIGQTVLRLYDVVKNVNHSLDT